LDGGALLRGHDKEVDRSGNVHHAARTSSLAPEIKDRRGARDSAEKGREERNG